MSSRKNVLKNWLAISNGDMSGDITSPATAISYLDNVGIQVSWTGTAPVGVINVQASNDSGATWTDMSFTPSPAVSGASGSILLSATGVPYTDLRVQYIRTSGTGTLKASISAKES
jgi:hypothetical protein